MSRLFDEYDSADTTEFISPWIAPPTTGVVITPQSILDPDHTVYAPLENTLTTKAPRPPRKILSKVIVGLFAFDVLLACYAIVALGRQQKPNPAVVVGTTIGTLTFANDEVTTTTSTSPVTTSTQPTTTRPPITTTVTTQAPKNTLAPKATVCLP